MKREWVTGDVAMLSFTDDRDCDHGPAVRTESGRWRCIDDGFLHTNAAIADARPLVVIDPENLDDAARLARAVWGDDFGGEDRAAEDMQAALRSLIRPPRPEEPQGLGAVVEDAQGKFWLRWEIANRHSRPWTVAGSIEPNRAYVDIDAVRVLSDGVQP